MNTTQTIHDAIRQSIATTSIVEVHTSLEPHQVIAAIQAMDGVEDVDFARENDGAMDVWGDVRGDQFRLRVVLH